MVSIDLKAIDDNGAELVGYCERATTLRAKYASKTAQFKVQAKEARKGEEELLHFEDIASQNLISFDKDAKSQACSIGKLTKRRDEMKSYLTCCTSRKRTNVLRWGRTPTSLPERNPP